MSGELLTTREVEQLIQLNRVTIYRLIREENFPAVKLGGQWRFPRQQVEAWLEAHGIESKQPAASSPTETSKQTTTAADITATTGTSDLKQLFNTIEAIALLDAFSRSTNLSISVVDVNGQMLVECPTCRHPFCQYVHNAGQHVCLAAYRDVTQQCEEDSGTPMLRCASGLKYLQAPVTLQNEVVAHVLMGPIVTEDDQDSDILPALDAFARATGADRAVLLQHYRTVQQFSTEQIHILVNLLSEVMSTMLRVIGSRWRAVERLNEIAQLATERQS